MREVIRGCIPRPHGGRRAVSGTTPGSGGDVDVVVGRLAGDFAPRGASTRCSTLSFPGGLVILGRHVLFHIADFAPQSPEFSHHQGVGRVLVRLSP